MTKLPIVDAHLDLAETVTLFGRDVTLEIAEIRAGERRTANQATVCLPELERGGIAVVIATVTPGFLAADVGPDFQPKSALYRTPQEAEAQALSQIRLYEQWANQRRIRLIKSRTDLDHHLQLWEADAKPGLVFLMEGADPIVHVRDLRNWWRRGLRMIGLTFGSLLFGLTLNQIGKLREHSGTLLFLTGAIILLTGWGWPYALALGWLGIQLWRGRSSLPVNALKREAPEKRMSDLLFRIHGLSLKHPYFFHNFPVCLP